MTFGRQVCDILCITDGIGFANFFCRNRCYNTSDACKGNCRRILITYHAFMSTEALPGFNSENGGCE